jgi:predicted TIM-barrel fold metal-dependent hydrolase
MRACLVVGSALLQLTVGAAATPKFVPWQADHHMHIRSKAIYDTYVVLCASFDKKDCPMPDPKHPVQGAGDVIAALDEVGSAKGVVLSMAYFFGSPYVASQHYDVARMTRAENEYVAGQVSRYPDRLIGFFSVDPVVPSAAAEVQHWLHDPRLKGLKLHFANSGVHLRDPAQVRQIAGVVGTVGAAGLPMVIHLRTANAFSAEETEIFIRDILPRAGSARVQIAHAVAWYGIDKTMLDALETFATHIARDDPATRHVLFDLAAVVTPETTPREAAALVTLMRKIGLSRFVLGSDFDAFTPRQTDDLLRQKLPLTNEEWRTVVLNCAPWAC